MSLWRTLRLLGPARRVAHAVAREGLSGAEFHRFGRALGRRLLLRRPGEGLELLVAPVESVRCFEFPFARESLGDRPGRCLDVSSPRLFSLHAALRGGAASVTIVNPDGADAARTSALVAALGLERVVDVVGADARFAAERPASFDAVWSLSVVEHIDGDYGDHDAVRWMWEALRPGGRLVLTVPVDRALRVETRDQDPYGTQRPMPAGGWFFQRLYDLASLQERIISAVGQEPASVRWFGERAAGSYQAFERRWIAEGLAFAVRAPLEMRDRFQEYPSWESMPGMGVCGLLFVKPGAAGELRGSAAG